MILYVKFFPQLFNKVLSQLLNTTDLPGLGQRGQVTCTSDPLLKSHTPASSFVPFVYCNDTISPYCKSPQARRLIGESEDVNSRWTVYSMQTPRAKEML